MPATMLFGAASDVGQVRTKNDDAWYAAEADGIDQELMDQRGTLFAVADGVGGEEGGDRASLIALAALSQTLYGAHAEAPEELLRRGIEEANARVRAEARASQDASRMATTLTALLVFDDRILIGHVGDSRAYLLREGEIRQLTRDHSRVAQLVESGALTKEEAKDHPDAHVITRAIGIADSVEVDLQAMGLRKGDRFLLCSDGLTDMVSESAIAAASASGDPAAAVEELVAQANEAGGEDNITCVLVAPDVKVRKPIGALWRQGILAAVAVAGVAGLLIWGRGRLGAGPDDGELTGTQTEEAVSREGTPLATVAAGEAYTATSASGTARAAATVTMASINATIAAATARAAAFQTTSSAESSGTATAVAATATAAFSATQRAATQNVPTKRPEEEDGESGGSDQATPIPMHAATTAPPSPSMPNPGQGTPSPSPPVAPSVAPPVEPTETRPTSTSVPTAVPSPGSAVLHGG